MHKSDTLSIQDIILKSTNFLERHGVRNAKIDSEWLTSHVLKCKRMDLYLRHNELISSKLLSEIRSLVLKRSQRIPLQHILGGVPFAGLTLKCDSRALIPRHETEFFVDLLCNQFSCDYKHTIIDLGTGSGAIILALCSFMPMAKGVGLEKTDAALSLAKENLFLNNLENRVSMHKFDWTKDEFSFRDAGLIVSNPPYLSQNEWRASDPEVKEHDPKSALISDKNGLQDIEIIILLASRYLSKGSYLALEFGHSQARQVSMLLENNFEYRLYSDQQLVRRFVLAKKN